MAPGKRWQLAVIVAIVAWSCGGEPGTDAAVVDPSETGEGISEPTDTPTPADDPPTGQPLPEVACDRYLPPKPAPSRLSGGSLRAQPMPDVRHPGKCHVMEDFDGDGIVDMVVYDADDSSAGVRLWWMWGRADGGLDRVTQPVNRAVGQCIAYDHDHDGQLELIVAMDNALQIIDGLDARTPTFSAVRYPMPGIEAGTVFSMAVLPLDGQAVDDLMIAIGGEANVCVAPEEDPDGDQDVIIDAEPIIQGRVICARAAAGGGWEADDGSICPSSVQPTPTTFPFAISLQDLDDDTLPEVLVTGDFAPNVVLQRDTSGRWSDITARTGFGAYNHAMGVAWADFDLDGLRDAWVTDYGPSQFRWNQDCTTFFDAEQLFGVAAITAQTITWGVAAFDLDNDGDEDAVVAQSMEVPEGRLNESVCDLEASELPIPPLMLMANDGTGRFVRHDLPAPTTGYATALPNHVLAGDLDNDGGIDVLNVQQDYGTTLLRNRTSGRGHYIMVRPVDEVGSAAWGTRVVVDDGAGERVRELHLTTSTTGQGPAVAHVGLGERAGPVDVRVRWPDGVWTLHEGLEVDREHRIAR